METFNELNIDPTIMKAIAELGFEKPSPIQAQTIPLLLEEATDFIGLAATGTGKTAAFSIPLLERVDPKIKVVQAVVLCPTRELALQVTGQINLLGKYKKIKAVPIYGGASYGDQIYGLKSGANVVVGTPGRIVDHIERGTLKLDELKTVILDEADEMISMGFKEDLEKILDATDRDESNIWLFSATMSKGVRSVADEYLTDPKSVHTNKKEVLSATVEQIYYMTQESNKPEVLCKIIDAAEDFYGVIFCQTKAMVQDLAQYLSTRGYQVDSLHGDKDQKGRERTMKAFRDKKINVLICTDVASRGIDVKDITHVINYSLPRELDAYVHRIGRTARSGKKGFAMSLVTQSHRRILGRLEQLTKSKIKEGVIPTRKEIGTKKVTQHLEKFLSQTNFKRAIEVMDDNWKAAIVNMTPEEVAARFLTLTFSEIFSERPKEKGAAMPGPNRDRDQEGAGSSDRRSRYDDSSRGGRRFDRGDRGDRSDRGGGYRDRPRFNDRPRGGNGGGRDRFSSDSAPHRGAGIVRADRAIVAPKASHDKASSGISHAATSGFKSTKSLNQDGFKRRKKVKETE